MFRDFLAWLIGKIWAHEKAVTATLTIDGIVFPISDFEAAITVLQAGLKAKKSAKEIFDSLGPALLPIIETLANYLVPGVGTGIELIDFIVKNSTPFWALSQNEQNKIQDQQGSGPT